MGDTPQTLTRDDEKPADTAQPVSGFAGLLRLGLGSLGAALLMVMMVLTVCDVVGRYVFNAPVAGATELTGMLLAAVIFLGVPAVSFETEHVTVDLMSDRVPGWIVPFRKLATGLLSAVVLAVVAWRIWVYASQIGGYGGTTTTLELPVAPLGYFCSVCTMLGAALTFYVSLLSLGELGKGRRSSAVDTSVASRDDTAAR